MRLKIILSLAMFLWLSLIAPTSAQSEECPNENYVFWGSYDIEAFEADNCSRITGNLEISIYFGEGNDSGLNRIEEVGGTLTIKDSYFSDLKQLKNLREVESLVLRSNRNLSNVDGLENLESAFTIVIDDNDALVNVDALSDVSYLYGLFVTNNANLESLKFNGAAVEAEGYEGATVLVILNIYNNGALSDLDSFKDLVAVYGWLQIYDNPSLDSIAGLANLELVGSGGEDSLYGDDAGLYLGGNSSLKNLDPLTKLREVDGLWIWDSSLLDVSGLSNLEYIKGNLRIYGNDGLTKIDALANVAEIEGYLTVSKNDELRNVDGLSQIQKIGGGLIVSDNATLRNLDGLRKLDHVGGMLEIVGNDSLGDCSGVAPVLGWPNGPPEEDFVAGIIFLERNGGGCSSIEAILSGVAGPTKPEILATSREWDELTVSFVESYSGESLFPITGYETSCSAEPAFISESVEVEIRDLEDPVLRSLVFQNQEFIRVSDGFRVDLEVTHSDPEDLTIKLISPDGTNVTLWDQQEWSTEDIDTYYSDGTVVEAFVGESLNGEWTLSLQDVDVGPIQREGVLNSWGITQPISISGSSEASPLVVEGIVMDRQYTCELAPVTELGAKPSSDPFSVGVMESTEMRFMQLLDTVSENHRPLRPDTTGDYDAGKTINLVTSEDIQLVIDRASERVYGDSGVSRIERLKPIEDESGEPDWDAFDSPTWERRQGNIAD